MSIIVDKVQKSNPLRREEPKKWYMVSKRVNQITEKEVARQIARRTALNQKEAEMALFLLREVLIENLLNGYTVKLGDWASFIPTVKSEGSETKEEANATKIKRVKLHLRFNKSFEAELQSATFVPAESISGQKG